MGQRKYHIPVFPTAGIFILFLTPWVILFWSNSGYLLLLIVVYLFVFILILFTAVVEINSNEIKLYRVNRMEWGEVIGAKLGNIIGLRYLILMRKKGMDWWLPLYFKGEKSIQSTLIDLAPSNSPIRLALFDSYNKTLKEGTPESGAP